MTNKIASVRVNITGPNAITLTEAAAKRGVSVTQLVHKLIEELAK